MEILLIAIVVTLGLLFNIWLFKKGFGLGNRSSGDGVKRKSKASVDFEEQISDLGNIGIRLKKEVTYEDLYLSYPKETYEDDPFGLLLSIMGGEIEAEPWGRRLSDDAFNLDYECIEDEGSYVSIVRGLARIAGLSARISDLTDSVDFENDVAALSFTLDGEPHSFRPIVDDDWADTRTILDLTRLFERATSDGRMFWTTDEGQASTFVFLTDEDAANLNALAPKLVKRFT